MPGDDRSDDEWERVFQNPDNMIVSDVLRDRVAALLLEEKPPAVYRALVTAGNRVLSMELLRIDQSSSGVEILGVSGFDAMETLLEIEPDEWKTVEVMRGDISLRSFDLHRRGVSLSCDVSASVGTCNVTLSWCKLIPKTVL